MTMAGQAYAQGMKWVSELPCHDRPAFKMALHVHEGRWYLYCAHFWHSGWSITEIGRAHV